MQVRVLGCSGAIAKDCRTTSFLVDSDLLVDAGTGVGDLSLDEMGAIDDVVLTHSHLDHIAALPLMIDAVASRRGKPLRVHALRATIEALRAHVFNNIIWPDFASIPSLEAPFVSFHDIVVGQQLQLGTRALKNIEVLPAVHTVPACGYAVRCAEGGPNWVFSGDTERNPAFWQRVNQLDVGMLVIETAFSNREQALAQRSLHLSPATLAGELAHIAPGKSYPIYITHTKPAETGEIMSQIDMLAVGSRVQGTKGWDIRWLEAAGVLQV
ncbi:3',5'-cyclic-nucleotide phosphodiesterase [Variovorax sp. MHTC-1]|uniref:3',5'-cyclic-nucleotide phosphodiesterase n=1 Tax=Variovorax sp. MHTC-1 TaxID=2495593 RepID=UPI000F85FBA3|nr:3',5'-cyclic-nucleotide phosphodiesterase [Variovorax sp. MHTC-1]RST56113.1 3',5'-cyclic-nucleotide phosphodiesterase [Variovorax sp. MHTC-1]